MGKRCKVLYQGESGIMTFENKKVVFQNKNVGSGVSVGLGVIEDGSLVDKGNYMFANMVNVVSVVPSDYFNIDFFENKGVPKTVHKGYFGDSVLLKEEYNNKVQIKAYDIDGNILLYESKQIVNKSYKGLNVYFVRLDTIVTDWEDITEQVRAGVLESVKCKVNNSHIDDVLFVDVLSKLKYTKVYEVAESLIVVNGNFESLIVWSDCDKPLRMAWLGKLLSEDDLVGLVGNFNIIV